MQPNHMSGSIKHPLIISTYRHYEHGLPFPLLIFFLFLMQAYLFLKNGFKRWKCWIIHIIKNKKEVIVGLRYISFSKLISKRGRWIPPSKVPMDQRRFGFGLFMVPSIQVPVAQHLDAKVRTRPTEKKSWPISVHTV